jgi:hypothetical protein
MQNILTTNYWFDLKPPYFTPNSEKIFIAILLFFLVSAIIFFVLKRKKSFFRGVYINLYNFSLSNFSIGLLLIFFRYEKATFLSGRFWMGLWLIAMIIWLYFILKNIKKIPENIKKLKEEEERKKYIP